MLAASNGQSSQGVLSSRYSSTGNNTTMTWLRHQLSCLRRSAGWSSQHSGAWRHLSYVLVSHERVPFDGFLLHAVRQGGQLHAPPPSHSRCWMADPVAYQAILRSSFFRWKSLESPHHRRVQLFSVDGPMPVVCCHATASSVRIRSANGDHESIRFGIGRLLATSCSPHADGTGDVGKHVWRPIARVIQPDDGTLHR